MARTTKTPQAPPDETALATRAPAEISAEVGSFLEQNSGDVLGNLKAEDFNTPYLMIVAKNSKIIDDVEGAQPGDIMDSATQELWDGDEGVHVIPCAYTQVFVEKEWDDAKNQPGNFVAVHPEDTPLRNKLTQRGRHDVLPSGHVLQDNRQVFCLVETETGWEMRVVSFRSTNIPVFRKWNTTMQSQRLPSRKISPPYGFSYRLKTERRENGDYRWYVYRIGAPEGPVTDLALLQAAKEFHDRVLGGKVKAAAEIVEDRPAAGTPGSKAGFPAEPVSEDSPY